MSVARLVLPVENLEEALSPRGWEAKRTEGERGERRKRKEEVRRIRGR